MKNHSKISILRGRLGPLAILFLAPICVSAHGEPPVAESEAKKSFELLKNLAGTCEGPATVKPVQPNMGSFTQVAMRVTSRGNALVHEIGEPNQPNDPTRHDYPLWAIKARMDMKRAK